MLFIEIAILELTGGHIEILLFFLEMEKNRISGGHIEIILCIEMEKLE